MFDRFMRTIAIALLASLSVAATAHASVDVSYEAEKGGVENTTATFSFSGVETFNGIAPGIYNTPITDTVTNAANPAQTITATYTAAPGSGGVDILKADQYGGAGGNTNYIVAMGQTAVGNTDYTLNLSSTGVKGGVNYFGLYLSALDAGNQMQFYGQNGQLLLTFNAADVLNLVKSTGEAGTFAGNPDAPFKSDNYGQPYTFINFFDTSGSFSKIVFSEVPVQDGGFESDNHTFGNYTSVGQGTFVPLVASVPVGAVPEASTWAMMLVGFAAVGMGMRAGRRTTLTYA